MWFDIGDHKAREKTSQALREGAPLIRDIVSQSPSNMAELLKEAKKSERAEKECGVTKLPKRALEKKKDAINHKGTSSPQEMSTERSPPNVVLNNGSTAMPPHKRFRSFAEQDIPAAANIAHHLQSVWQPIPQQPGRHFSPMHYAAHNAFASRVPTIDSVPVEVVRKLLLGQLDPVEVALHILSPEEAEIVARLHASSTRLLARYPDMSVNPLALAPVISDCSSGTPSDHSASTVQGDDGSSVSSSPKQSPTSTERALPKKKRKYIEE